MYGDVNQTYCGIHFKIYTNIESLCCMPKTNSWYMSIIPQKEKKYIYIV